MIADRLILFPSREPWGAGEAVRAPLPGTELEFWVHKRATEKAEGPPQLYLLHFIGNASRAEAEHPIFLDVLSESCSVEAWVLNYPGYGGSGGQARLKDFPDAACRAYEFMRNLAGERQLLISGNSLGTASALYLASRFPVAALILQNPPPIQNMILTRFGWWNLWIAAAYVASMVPKELNSLTNAPRAKAPALFFTSEWDLTVPPRYQHKVMDRYGGPCQQIVIPGASHNTTLPLELVPAVREAFKKVLRRS